MEPATSRLSRVKAMIIRRKIAIGDAILLLGVLALGAYFCWAFDLFANDDAISQKQETFELDEVLALSCLMLAGMASARPARASRA